MKAYIGFGLMIVVFVYIYPFFLQGQYLIIFVVLWVIGSLFFVKLVFGSLMGKEDRGRKHHKKLMEQDYENFYLKDHLKKE